MLDSKHLESIAQSMHMLELMSNNAVRVGSSGILKTAEAYVLVFTRTYIYFLARQRPPCIPYIPYL